MTEENLSPEKGADIIITSTLTDVGGDSTAITLETEHGKLTARNDPSIDMFSIDRVDVDPDFRRAGIGKALLRAVRSVAVDLRANEVLAVIISRESFRHFRMCLAMTQ